jgi:hypothetical protein
MPHRVDEARNLARYLRQVKHYPPQNMMLLTDDQNGPNGQPTKRNILGALFWLARNAVSGERLVLYYSGHGSVGRQGGRGGGRGRSGKKAAKQAKGGRKGKGKGKAREDGDEGRDGEGVDGEEEEEEEEGDGLETIYPVDFRSFKEGMIKPAELKEILAPAREAGAKLTIILDCGVGV